MPSSTWVGSVPTRLSDLAAGLADLVLPDACAACGAPARLVCDSCATALSVSPVPRGPTDCALPPTWAAGPYDGPVRAAVLACKDGGRRGLARPLGEALARAVACAAPEGPLALVPVPSDPVATRRRGEDPVLRCARFAARALVAQGRDARVCRVLRLSRRVADQAGLDERARARNLAGAHRVPARLAPSVRGRAVVLVDDVVTTGATLAEAARAARAAGLSPVAAATVASTVLRRPGSRAAPALHVDGSSV